MTVLKTQSSSKSRLKNDTIGDEGLRNLYDNYGKLNAEAFRIYCIQLVKSGGGNEPTKQAIIQDLQMTGNKDRMLQKTNNFIFAGQGFGV